MVDVVFACINFGVLVALGVYGLYVYMLPGVRSAIQHEQAEHDTLIAQRTQLREACRTIEDRIAQQEERYHTLYDRMAAWSQVVQEERNKREQTYRQIKDRVQERREQQQAYRVYRKLLQEHLPQAFAQAEQQLRSQYDAQAGRAYIQRVIEEVEQSHG